MIQPTRTQSCSVSLHYFCLDTLCFGFRFATMHHAAGSVLTEKAIKRMYMQTLRLCHLIGAVQLKHRDKHRLIRLLYTLMRFSM